MANDRTFLDITPDAGAQFFGSPGDGPVVMLNLLRFKQRADYAHAPDLEPSGGASGAEAYALYMKELEPLLLRSGGEILFQGTADSFLVGPREESWEFAMLVRQASKASFLAFASDPQAQRMTQHRTAAIQDSRLLPLWPGTSLA